MTQDPRTLAVQGIEIWRHVPDTKYEASNLGRLRNPKTGNIIGTHRIVSGYLAAPNILVHRAVLTAFEGPRPPNIVVRHKDSDRANNVLTNLEWGTRVENAADTEAAGRLRHRNGTVPALTPDLRAETLQAVIDGRLSPGEAATKVGRTPEWVTREVTKIISPPSTFRQTAVSLETARETARRGEEVWVPALGFPEAEVSNLGRLRIVKTQRVRNLSGAEAGGYPRYGTTPLHRIVMTTFSDPPFEGALIRHTPDPDRTNNSVLNLEWGTYAENSADTKAQGRTRKGDSHPRSVLTQEKVEEGLRRFVAENWTTARLALFLGTWQGNASDIVSGKSWAHAARPEMLRRPATRRRGLTKQLAHLDTLTIEHALARATAEGWAAPRLAKELGIALTSAAQLLEGKPWQSSVDPADVPDGPVDLPLEESEESAGCANHVDALCAQIAQHTRTIETFAPWTAQMIILSRDQVIRATESDGRKAVENRLLPAVLSFLRRYVELRGWFYPTCAETLQDVLRELAEAPPTLELTAKSRTGNSYLQARFHSFWDVDHGPVKRFHGPKGLDAVARYRLGLNNSKLYTYTLSDGRKVKSQETFDITLHTILRGFIVQHAAVSFFKPQNAASIYRATLSGCSAPRVWNPSCGFGARLLGFAATFPDGTYYGCEPAAQTRRDVLSLAADLQQVEPSFHAHISAAGSEEPQPFADASLDFVFTSPPYFDLEQYFDEPTQCWKRFPTRATWEEGFLLPTFREAFRGLKPDCMMAINVAPSYADAVRNAAILAGFAENGALQLTLGAGPFHKATQSEDRSEPILLFVKPGAGPSTPP